MKKKLTLQDLAVLSTSQTKAFNPVVIDSSTTSEPQQVETVAEEKTLNLGVLPTELNGLPIRYLSKVEAEAQGLDKKWGWLAWRMCTTLFSINGADWAMLSGNDETKALSTIQEKADSIKKHIEWKENNPPVPVSYTGKKMPNLTGGVGWARDEDSFEW